MKIKAAACMLALVSAPALASAQVSSPAPAPPPPVAAPAVSPPAHAWPTKSAFTPADIAQLKAQGAAIVALGKKQRALMERSRAALFAAISPAHRDAVATVIGELAMSPDPDANAAAKRIDAILSPQEKDAIIVAYQATRSTQEQLRQEGVELHAQSSAFRKHLDAERAAAGWPVPAPVARPPVAPPPAIHKEWKTRTPDAGWYLVVAAQYGPRIHGIVIPPERWGFFSNS